MTRTSWCVVLGLLAGLPAHLVAQRGGGGADPDDRPSFGVGVQARGGTPGVTFMGRAGASVDLGFHVYYALGEDEVEGNDPLPATTQRQETLTLGPTLRWYTAPDRALTPTVDLFGGWTRIETTTEAVQTLETVTDGVEAGGSIGLTWFASRRFQVGGGLSFRYSALEDDDDVERTSWRLFEPAVGFTFRF